MDPNQQDKLKHGIQAYAGSRDVKIADECFIRNELMAVVSPGVVKSDSPVMLLIAELGITLENSGNGYVLVMRGPGTLAHAWTVGNYVWKNVTARQSYVQSFQLASRIRSAHSASPRMYGMPAAEFVGLTIYWHVCLYADELQTPRRWTAAAVTRHMRDVKGKLPEQDWQQYVTVVRRLLSALGAIFIEKYVVQRKKDHARVRPFDVCVVLFLQNSY